MRVANLILPSLAAFALAGAPAASAAGGGATAGGSSAAAPTSAGASTNAGAVTQPSFSGPTQGPGHCTAATSSATATSGGAGVGGGGGTNATSAALPCQHPTVPGMTARIIHGLAYAPADAPLQVQQAIWAGDRIRLKPYRVGGGHGVWNDTAYDCSGTVSYVLHAAHLINVSMDSGQMMSWGRRGAGAWMTIYTNPGHAFIEIAGIRLDTSAEGDPHPAPGSGPRWRPLLQDTGGYVARHPVGF